MGTQSKGPLVAAVLPDVAKSPSGALPAQCGLAVPPASRLLSVTQFRKRDAIKQAQVRGIRLAEQLTMLTW